MTPRKDAPPLLHFVGGWLGGTVASILLSPLEVLKTRMQSFATNSTKMSARHLAVQIAKHEGALGFYRGLIPHLLGDGPARALYFGTYNFSKRELQTHAHLNGAPLHLLAAASATGFASTLMSPVWVVKTRLQLQKTRVTFFGSSSGATNAVSAALTESAGKSGGVTSVGSSAVACTVAGLGGARGVATAAAAAATDFDRPYTSMADAFKRMYREEGMKSFYRGLTASYLGVFESGIQFAMYGYLKESVKAAQKAHLLSQGVAIPTDHHEQNRLLYSDSAAFFTSAFCKLVAGVLTYPHEVLRTRMRECRTDVPRYNGLFQTGQLIWREEGFKALYGGLGVHMVRTVPNAAILLMVVERVVGGDV